MVTTRLLKKMSQSVENGASSVTIQTSVRTIFVCNLSLPIETSESSNSFLQG